MHLQGEDHTAVEILGEGHARGAGHDLGEQLVPDVRIDATSPRRGEGLCRVGAQARGVGEEMANCRPRRPGGVLETERALLGRHQNGQGHEQFGHRRPPEGRIEVTGLLRQCERAIGSAPHHATGRGAHGPPSQHLHGLRRWRPGVVQDRVEAHSAVSARWRA